MTGSRATDGKSNPVTYSCGCAARAVGGAVLLFYRYWTNDPPLPKTHLEKTEDLEALAGWHRALLRDCHMMGKVRIAKEGYNVTVGGTSPDIREYVARCKAHWSFEGLELDEKFFKPSDGCACVFDSASVRVTAEITPMGLAGYLPEQWGNVRPLSPEEFHQKCHQQKSLLIDVRNHYESRIGYFISPITGEPAIRPPIRRFSQWPHYISQNLDGLSAEHPKQILTYCTGGIRCEKAVRWMQEKVVHDPEAEVFTLRGGIAAYLAWMDEEIKAGRKKPEESLFLGRNFVFDGRGSTALESAEVQPVSNCHVCGTSSSGMAKCTSTHCHLILIVCDECKETNPRCCEDCESHDKEAERTPNYICKCEKERETQLWGGERARLPPHRRQKRGQQSGNKQQSHARASLPERVVDKCAKNQPAEVLFEPQLFA